ncbi:MAG: B12-binding domain-containing radical SAM protein [Elusimicrobia bacterium]|nr:B12-binding domain-containing radical SAM protein [Elusimicrobiota bacterium]
MSANDFPMVWGPHPPVTLAQLAAMAGPSRKVKIFDALVSGLDLREFGKWAAEADAIGITCSASQLALNAEITVRLVRRLRPDLPIIMGGHHPTFYGPEWLARGATIIVHGEGEHTLAELLDRIEKKRGFHDVKGISFMEGGQVVRTPEREMVTDLDSLPFPAWDMMDLRGYQQFTARGGLTVSLETSRGCTNRCSFCLATRMWDGKQRYRSIPKVIEDLKRLQGMGADQLLFVGDGFGNPPEYHAELMREMLKTGIDMHWMSFMRVDSILKDPILPALMARSGCKAVFIGFESPRQDLLKKWNKGPSGAADVSTYPEVFRLLDQAGILVFGFLLVGHPDERPEDIPETMRLNQQWCDIPLVNALQPMKGTPDYNDYERRGILAKDMFYHDVRIPSLKGVEKNVPIAMRIFMRQILFKFPFHVFSRKETKRRFLRHMYRFLAGEFAAASLDGMRDYLKLLNFGGLSPAELQDAIVRKHTSEERLALLARASAGSRPVPDPDRKKWQKYCSANACGTSNFT